MRARTWLDQYAAGAHDEVLQELSRELVDSSLAPLARALGQAIRESPAPRAAAAFALEAADRIFEIDQQAAVHVVEAGENRLDGHDSPTDWELTWRRAAVALLQGPPPISDTRLALGRAGILLPAQTNDTTVGRGDDLPRYRAGIVEQLDRARQRFPADAAFLLATAFIRELRAQVASFTQDFLTKGPIPNLTHGPTIVFNTKRDGSVPAAILESIVAESTELRAEATLHLGSVRFYERNHAEALRLWTSLGGDPDPRIRYLSRTFAARVLWRQPGGVAEALDRLRRASEDYPGAQTARRFAATLLYLSGRHEEARQIADRLLAGPAGDDPWWSYLRGEYVRWPDHVARLRAAARR